MIKTLQHSTYKSKLVFHVPMSFFVNRLCFKVIGELGHGQEVRVSGNIALLGCGDPNKSFPLVTSSDAYPKWTLQKDFLNVPGDPRKIKYRYCVFTGGKFDRWETAEERVLDYFKFINGICTVEDKLDVSQREFNDLTHNPIGLRYDEQEQKFTAANRKIKDEDTVMIVSYLLPLTLSKSSLGEWQIDWDPNGDLSFHVHNTSMLYVGVVLFNDEGIPPDQQEEVTALLKPLNCHPVFLDTDKHDVFGKLLNGYHQWQIMHDKVNVFAPLHELLNEAEALENNWQIYCEVHTRFVRKVVELYHSDYFIWIHDFHLMLLPERVRHKIPTARIGFVFHVPFPVSDTWSTVHKRDELLRGVLAADQICFHLYDHSINFLSSCCRLLGYNHYTNAFGQTVIDVNGCEVAIENINRGLNLSRIKEICSGQGAERFVEAVGKWRDRFSGKIIIGGIAGSVEYVKGITIKFIEFDQFLMENPQYLDTVVFVLIGITPVVADTTYHAYEGETRKSVAHINRKFGREVVYYEERKACDMLLADRLAFFAAVDVFHLTTLVETVELYAQEFAQARHELTELSNRGLTGSMSLPTNGMMVLSRLAAYATELLGAIIVDPRNIGETKDALKKVLEMSPEEIYPLVQLNLERVLHCHSDNWALTMLDDLKSASEEVLTSRRKIFVTLSEGFKTIEGETVVKDYRGSKCRVIMLNCEIVEKLTAEQRAMIETLGVDKNNLVFLIGRKSKEIVVKLLNDSKCIGYSAEYGYCYRWPLNKFSPDKSAIIAPTSILKWQKLGFPVDTNWKVPVGGLMDLFAKHTDQAYVEAFEQSIRWLFSKSDPEFGFRQSRTLADFIAKEFGGLDIAMTQHQAGDESYLEVRSGRVSKGAFLESVLLTLQSVNVEVDFLLAVGMDETDESLFVCANQVPDSELYKHTNVTVHTANVGKRISFAQSCFSDLNEALALLQRLAGRASMSKKVYSTNDLSALQQKSDNDGESREHILQRLKVAPTAYNSGDIRHAVEMAAGDGTIGANVADNLAESASSLSSAATASGSAQGDAARHRKILRIQSAPAAMLTAVECQGAKAMSPLNVITTPTSWKEFIEKASTDGSEEDQPFEF